MKTVKKLTVLFAGPVVVSAALGLAGCGALRVGTPEETQALITRQLAGMPVGEFIERYGKPGTIDDGIDGSLSFNWQSSVGAVPAGPFGLDERVCRLRVHADKSGRIVSAQVRNDNVGRVSQSRCTELFAARAPR